MAHKKNPSIKEAKQRCIEFAKTSSLDLPNPRNKLAEELLGNNKLSVILELTMDRLEDKYAFSRYDRIKGCEEFIEFKIKHANIGSIEELSYQLIKFTEEIMALLEELGH